ncbi:MAG: hypothetical protein AB1491_09355 [Thermodesulfobacteriota bacterium]
MDEHGFEPATAMTVAPADIVTAVFPHPLHGRLIERVIFFVKPFISYKDKRYNLSWWGNGIAYYHPAC